MALHQGDKLCKLTRTKKLEFGRVTEHQETSPRPNNFPTSILDLLDNDEYKRSSGFSPLLPTNKVSCYSPVVSKGLETKLKIIWERKNNDQTAEFYKVADRKFALGQTVMRNGVSGRITDILPLVTLKVIRPEESNNCVIPDIPVDHVKPISPIFSGVTVVYSNYIGQVLDVQRRTTYRLSDGSTVAKLTMDSVVVKESTINSPVKRQHPAIQKLFAYPYSSNLNGLPFLGKSERFYRAYVNQLREEMESEKENQEPVCNSVSKLTRKKASDVLEAVVENIEITGLKVKWTGQLPQHLSTKSKQMPPALLNSEHLHQVTPLYVPSSMYLDKHAGLCSVDVPEDKLLPETTWAETFYDNPCNQSKDQVVPNQRSRTFLVTKHFVRHQYRVIWNTKQQSALYFGIELEPKLELNHSICLGHIHSHVYVVAKDDRWGSKPGDYGVVVEKLPDDSIVVEWLKISNGQVETERILKCSLLDVDKHPVFNELHEGKLVVRSRNAGSCGNFQLGTVLKIKRFEMGQILVHSPKHGVLELWPHMLDPFNAFNQEFTKKPFTPLLYTN